MDSLLTIFTIPKPFKGHSNVIQINAIKSWLHLTPRCEIILMGDDEGVAETAHELGVKHISLIKKNEFGTPLLSSAFSFAQKLAKNDILVYVNSDIIFFQDLIESVHKVKILKIPSFLMCGRRWDLDLKYEINFNKIDWDSSLLKKLETDGQLHGLSGLDYFVFRRNSVNLPPFAVGRQGWDVWLISYMRRNKVPVIDASTSITVIHQNHDFGHSIFGKNRRVVGPELKKNIEIAGGYVNMMTLRDADWIMDNDKLERPQYPRRIYSLLSLWYPWRILLAAKRWFREQIKHVWDKIKKRGGS